MKTIRLLATALLVALCTGFSSCGEDDDATNLNNEDGNGTITGTTAKIDLKKAGSLSTLISDDVKYNITDLTITGDINGDDIGLIREMAGADMNGDETKGNLSILNLKDANIVAGGNPYYIITDYDHAFYSRKDIVGSHIFSHCNKLTSLILPSSAIEIEIDIFSDTSYLGVPATKNTSVTTITIGDKVQIIDSGAFSDCSGLKEFIISEGNSNYSSLNGVLFNKNKSILIECPQTKSNCTIPNSVTEIGDYAFIGCSSLTSITVPNSVTKIGQYAFRECSSLKEIHCQSTTPPLVGYPYFDVTLYDICKLYIPTGSLQQYIKAAGWGFQTKIEE